MLTSRRCEDWVVTLDEPARARSDQRSCSVLPASHQPGRELWGWGYLVAGAVFVALGAVSSVVSSRLVWVDRLLEHPFTFGFVGAVLVSIGFNTVTSTRWIQLLGGLTAATVAACVAITGLVVSFLFTEGEVARVVAPGGDYLVVVDEVSVGMIDTGYLVTIEQQRGPLSRSFQVGCLTYDSGENDFVSVGWRTSRRLIVTTASRPITVRVDPDTGLPRAGRDLSFC